LARGLREGGLYRILVDPVAHVHFSERFEDPSTFEEAHAWQEVIEPNSTPIADALITSCVDEDVISFNLQYSPSMTRENVDIFVPYLEAQEHVGVPIASMIESVPPRRYASHVALVSSICETSIVHRRRGMMMRLISSMILPMVH
jgi:hypothetical protein